MQRVKPFLWLALIPVGVLGYRILFDPPPRLKADREESVVAEDIVSQVYSTNEEGNVGVVLIHGGEKGSAEFQRVFNAAPENYHLMTWDRPGHGILRELKAAPLARQARFTAHLVNRLPGDKPVILVGRGFGCLVAARTAMLLRHRVQAVVLVSGIYRTPTDEESLLILRKRIPTETARKEILDLEHYFSAPGFAWSDIRCPVYILQGEKDPLAGEKDLAEIIEKIRHVRVQLSTVNGRGPDLLEKDPRLLFNLIEGIISPESGRDDSNLSEDNEKVNPSSPSSLR